MEEKIRFKDLSLFCKIGIFGGIFYLVAFIIRLVLIGLMAYYGILG